MGKSPNGALDTLLMFRGTMANPICGECGISLRIGHLSTCSAYPKEPTMSEGPCTHPLERVACVGGDWMCLAYECNESLSGMEVDACIRRHFRGGDDCHPTPAESPRTYGSARLTGDEMVVKMRDALSAVRDMAGDDCKNAAYQLGMIRATTTLIVAMAEEDEKASVRVVAED